MTASVVFAALAIPGLLSLLGTAVLIRLAPRLGLIDQPSERKVHTKPTPRAGGLAIVAATVIARFFFPDLFWWHWYRWTVEPVLVFSLLIAVLGLLDDRYSLPWQVRLGIQIAVAALAVHECLYNADWPQQLVAVLWVVAMTNAFNMLDNMDALLAGVAWIAAGFLGLASWLIAPRAPAYAAPQAIVPYLLLMGALLGFLWFNRPPARIFMGDSGSTFLGFFLSLGAARFVHDSYPRLSIRGAKMATALSETWGAGPRGSWAWATILAIFAVPCYDMASVIFLRLKQGRSPFHADKQHLSHRLVERGLSKPAAVGVIYLMAVASGATGLVLLFVTTPVVAALAGGQLVVWWVAFAIVEWLSVRRSV